ncbi:DUF6969 family protein [Dichotomicrobium thermohalophilum]|uniref:DUF6969 domain-containing protein n=1 Tax=Dichotomicrobium thermohalophilum TaxID=933063 RepID=A0A397QCL8_9HYPH|nr:hypothetical protein [Dichotomicrobium thermohalophilum]RIA56001.1 hypothetical protein BXY53_1090 [Dichotomicrobium thermohalophilum]
MTTATESDLRALIEARPRDELEAMHAAAERVLTASAALAEAGKTVVTAVMPGQAALEAWAHYPAQDIRDPATGVQFYYHAHPEHDRGAGEHGHFHVFAPAGVEGPQPADDNGHLPAGGQSLCHLIGISMDAYSQPIGLFTTNRWVTGETWLPAEDVIERVRAFEMQPQEPFAQTRTWLAGMMTLFRPQIEALITERDRRVAAWHEEKGGDIFEDRALNRTSAAPINLADQITVIEEALGIRQTV